MALERTTRTAASFLRPPQTIDLTPAQWNEDLEALVQILSTKHGDAFHHTPRTKFLHEVEQTRQRLGTSNGIENAHAFRRLGALVGDGHTDVGFPRGRPRLPIETFWFEDGLRVVAAPVDQPDLLGTRIVSIGGIPTDTVVSNLRQFVGQAETEWAYKSSVPYLLYRTDLLQAVGAANGEEAEMLLEAKDGAQRSVRLKGVSGSIDKVRLGGEGPLWQRRPNEIFWRERWSDGTVYVNWRGYDDLAANSEALFAELDEERPRRLIIDLRDNSGGDFNLGRAFVRAVQGRSWLNRKGVLYVLVGRATFSAAMTNAVDLAKHTEATLVGEPVGARPNGWQEVRRHFLPNSGLRVSVSTKNYEFLPGETLLRPTIEIAPRLNDWLVDRDSAVIRIIQLK